VRQQLVDARRRMHLDAEQDVGEVRDRVQVVRLARRDQRVEAGQVLASLVVPDEEEVLSSAATRSARSDA